MLVRLWIFVLCFQKAPKILPEPETCGFSLSSCVRTQLGIRSSLDALLSVSGCSPRRSSWFSVVWGFPALLLLMCCGHTLPVTARAAPSLLLSCGRASEMMNARRFDTCSFSIFLWFLCQLAPLDVFPLTSRAEACTRRFRLVQISQPDKHGCENV